MKLGIVGHGDEKFTKVTRDLAWAAMVNVADRLKATTIISGHSPLGGVDLWAEDLAAVLKIPMIVHAPTRFSWSGPGGYMDRNLQIARGSDLVLCVVVQELPVGFKGMRFPYCYHCKGRNPEHVKSGGCWTAWQCRQREWAIIPAAATHSSAQ